MLSVGFGCGMVVNPAISILGVYFKKRISIASGFVICGTGAGSLAFPYLTAYLLEEYRSSGTLLISGAITLNLIVAGALMRPLPAPRSSGHVTRASTIEEGIENIGFCTDTYEENTTEISLTSLENKILANIKENSVSSVQAPSGNPEQKTIKHDPSNLSISTIGYKEYENDNIFNPKPKLPKIKKEPIEFPWYLFRDLRFIMYTLTLMLFIFAYLNEYQLLPYKADEIGAGTVSPASMVAFMSISETIFRVLWGILWDHGVFRIPVIKITGSGLLLWICGGLLFACASVSVNGILAGWAVMMGILVAGVLSTIIPITMDITGPAQVGNGYSIIMLGQGVLMVVGPLFTGILTRYIYIIKSCFCLNYVVCICK